jgi:hypothetical protein
MAAEILALVLLRLPATAKSPAFAAVISELSQRLIKLLA